MGCSDNERRIGGPRYVGVRRDHVETFQRGGPSKQEVACLLQKKIESDKGYYKRSCHCQESPEFHACLEAVESYDGAG